jgi:hypothetical protein
MNPTSHAAMSGGWPSQADGGVEGDHPFCTSSCAEERGYERLLARNEGLSFLAENDPESQYGFFLLADFPLLDDASFSARTDPWFLFGLIYYWLGPALQSELTVKVEGMSEARVLRGMVQGALFETGEIQMLKTSVQNANRMLDSAKSDLDANLKSFQLAISKAREDTVFAQARTLWQTKAQQHTLNYAIGFCAIAGSIVAVALGVRHYGADFWSVLPKNEKTGEYTYLASFLVGILAHIALDYSLGCIVGPFVRWRTVQLNFERSGVLRSEISRSAVSGERFRRGPILRR